MSLARFISTNKIVLVRGEPIPPSSVYEREVAESWQRALVENPRLFNGPLASPLELSVSEDICTLRWYHSDFAHYSFSCQNRMHPTVALVGTIFVSVVVPTTDGGLIFGRMSNHTLTPGVVQLPGGGVPVGPEQPEISHRDLLGTAVQEVSEELGIILNPASLKISGVIERDKPPDVGIVFTTEPYAWDEIRRSFVALQERERKAGVESEFTELLIGPIGDFGHAKADDPTMVDYLPAVIDEFLKTRGDAA